LCLESFFLGIRNRDRQWIKHVRVNLYVGDIAASSLDQYTGQELVKEAEASCGAFVRSALKCQGVGSLVNVKLLGVIEEDDKGRRILRVSLTLK
jgi:hypothetical protein